MPQSPFIIHLITSQPDKLPGTFGALQKCLEEEELARTHWHPVLHFSCPPLQAQLALVWIAMLWLRAHALCLPPCRQHLPELPGRVRASPLVSYSNQLASPGSRDCLIIFTFLFHFLSPFSNPLLN